MPSHAILCDSFDADLVNAFFRPFQHRDALRALTVRCLERNEPAAAFMFADRLCRIGRGGDQRGLILRAEANLRLSATDAAQRDAEAAFEIDPTDLEAARVLIRCGHSESRRAAAKMLLEDSHADKALRLAALGVLLEDAYAVVAIFRRRDGETRETIVWRGETTLQVDWGDHQGAPTTTLTASPSHELAGPTWHATDLAPPKTLRGGISRGLSRLAFRSGQSPLPHLLIASPAATSAELLPETLTARATGRGPSARDRASPSGVTAIVPLFDDVRMTRLCLHSLARQQLDVPLKIILVHDNPGHSAMTSSARELAARHGFVLLENAQNLGFARSINRGLAEASDDDVVLLNSDVLLPPKALRKLSAAAYSAADIGTVTPLSNNGEEVSFPTPFRTSAILPHREIQAIDAVAGTVNASRVVPLANGVGFCLFVRRSALDAVGRLSTAYGFGYYEDVDYCLRVARAGFRNVCAPTVYVGHKGTTSFKARKRNLVVRNRRVLEARFPSYREESGAFLAADPLSAARAAIELAKPPSCSDLLVIPQEKLERAGRWLTRDGRVLRLTWSRCEPSRVDLRTSDSSSPQSLSFDLSAGDAALLEYLRRTGVSRVQLFGPCLERGLLIGRLKAAGAFVEMIFEESFLQPRPTSNDTPCGYDTPHPCDKCADAFKRTPDGAKGLGALLKTIDRVRPTNAMARKITEHFGLERADEPEPVGHVAAPARKALGARSLGVLYDASPDVDTEGLLATLMTSLVAPADFKLVVFGGCLDDIRMMSSGRSFVTGPILSDDLAALVRSYGIGALFAPRRWFGYGDLERLGMDLPGAYFDWSGGIVQKHADDLALDPRLCNGKIAHQLTSWLRRLGRADPSNVE